MENLNETSQIFLNSTITWGPMKTKVGKVDIILGLADDQFKSLTVSGKVGLFGLETQLKVSRTSEEFKAGKDLQIKFDRSAPPLLSIKEVKLGDGKNGSALLSLHSGKSKFEEFCLDISHLGDSYRSLHPKDGNILSNFDLAIGGLNLKKLYVKEYHLS